eukprot:363873-Chlamydomonas_euryale.AAC.7
MMCTQTPVQHWHKSLGNCQHTLHASLRMQAAVQHDRCHGVAARMRPDANPHPALCLAKRTSPDKAAPNC